VLALFVPLMISSGGNSGSQATTLVIRAMALGQVRLRDWWRVAGKEITAGGLLGGVLGTVGFCRIILWQTLSRWFPHGFFQHYQHPFLLGFTIFFALLGIVTWGTLIGSMLPFILRRLGLDPATSSAPFVATLVDVTGIFIYFSVAAMILGRAML
jgi:magnesium transporter